MIAGSKHSEETKEKIRIATSGSNSAVYGKKYSEETKNRMRLAHLGKKFSEERKKIMSLAHGRGENHENYKGDNVSYSGLHKWIRKYLPIPEFCEVCKIKTPEDVANLGIYNRDFKNWKYMCRKCHKAFDRNRRLIDSV